MALREDWGDIESLPPPRSGVPPWFWFCGGGCVLFLLLAGIASWWAVDWLREGTDAETQWTRLGDVLAYDERPEGWKLNFGQHVFGWDFFQFQQGEPNGESMWAILLFGEVDVEGETPAGMPEATPEGGEPIVWNIQGREVEGVAGRSSELPAPPGGAQGQAGTFASLDLSAATGEGSLTFLLYRVGSEEPITVEDATQFLAPFHIGPDR